MYSHGFAQLLAGGASGQPGWLADSVNWGARLANGNLTIWNTLFALTQVVLGFGLLYRPTVKAALAGSFGWVLIVWWFGEAFGMLFMNAAQPLTGAPGGGVDVRARRPDCLAQRPPPAAWSASAARRSCGARCGR